MDSKLHILITSEQDKARTFVFSKPVLKKLLITLSVVFVVSTVAGLISSFQNLSLKSRISNLENNLTSLSSKNKNLQTTVVSLEEKAKAQLTGAYGELNQRSKVIDSILSTLDITPHALNKDIRNTGGPFTSMSEETVEDLIMKVDSDIKLIRPIPLGFPVDATRISSGFGRRTDPMNGRNAFHDGIDLSGKRRSEVKATADGKVIERGYNDTYGWYVRIDHGNDYTTMFAHNAKIVARWGTDVKRGDVIALLGNTGRSTGPHLHYEVRYKGRPINPAKFININKLISMSSG